MPSTSINPVSLKMVMRGNEGSVNVGCKAEEQRKRGFIQRGASAARQELLAALPNDDMDRALLFLMQRTPIRPALASYPANRLTKRTHTPVHTIADGSPSYPLPHSGAGVDRSVSTLSQLA